MVKNLGKIKKSVKSTKSNSIMKTVIDFLLSENFHIGMTFLLAIVILFLLIFTYFNNRGEGSENFKFPKHYVPVEKSEDIQENYEALSSVAWEISTLFLYGLIFSFFTGLFISNFKNNNSQRNPITSKTVISVIAGFLSFIAVIYYAFLLYPKNSDQKTLKLSFFSVLIIMSLVWLSFNSIKKGICSQQVESGTSTIIVTQSGQQNQQSGTLASSVTTQINNPETSFKNV
jgi:hypothetical protein